MNRILITGCGGHFMKDLVACLTPYYAVIGAASRLDPNVAGDLYAYEQVPAWDDPTYIDVLLGLCAKYDVEVLLPMLDEELLPLLERRLDFVKTGTALSLTQSQGLYTAVDKLRFMHFLAKADIPHPEFRILEHGDDLIPIAKTLGFPKKPVCVKATNRSGSRGFRLMDDGFDYYHSFLNDKPNSRRIHSREMKRMLKGKELEHIILQEYLPGSEYSTDLLCDNGRVIDIVGRHNVVLDNSIPFESITAYNKAAYEISEQIVALLELDGNIGFDFIFNEEGAPIPIECNPRLTATLSLIAKSGVNMPMRQVERLLGFDLPDVEPKYGVKLVRTPLARFENTDDDDTRKPTAGEEGAPWNPEERTFF